MSPPIRIVHYLNQFFGQLGGESQAHLEPRLREGPVGPGVSLQEKLGQQARIVATIICGDNYVAEQEERAVRCALELMQACDAALFIAGPAFNAGRYGLACGAMCTAVHERFGIPALTGLHEENPAAEFFRRSRSLAIVRTGPSASSMRQALTTMAALALRLGRGEALLGGEAEGCLPRGVRVNVPQTELASQRAVTMLLRKLAGEAFKTEVPFQPPPLVTCAPPLADLRRARLALVTESGLVPRGNPDHLPSLRSSRYASYEIGREDQFEAGRYETIHAGYDKTHALDNPNRLVPLDVLRELERAGAIGALHDRLYTTAGCATYLEKAQAMARGIAQELRAHGVHGVILTAT
ncbi:MAG: glycine/betaine/sarcosine/D-proline family reductase selenoprotein B [Candidatus Tectomicrobia bacterium]|nr:glycine/betaine/sarcosine/D-proline family reductase selenoprotein B [Candidatus Tectomicrobia bacterium]